MKKCCIATLLISCFSAVTAQDVTLDWAKAFGNYADDYGMSIVADSAGNVYTLGTFVNTIDFDPGPGVVLADTGGIFISKHDRNGNILWVKTVHNGNIPLSMALDKKGNIYYGGSFSGSVDFDPGPGSFILSTPSFSQSAFISKLDNNGNFIWAIKVDNAAVNAIAVDASGNVYSTGSFYSVADFDAGPGTFNLTETGYIGLSTGILDIFVLKLDTNGNFIWADQMGGSSSDEGLGIATDNNNVVVTGYFQQTADFDPGPGSTDITSSGGRDIFVVKLKNDGTFVFAGSMGGASEDNGRSVCLDAAGNIYLSGDFYGTADFAPGTGVLNLISNPVFTSVFVSKLDPNGNLVWAKQLGGSGSDYGLGVSLDSYGNIYTTGSFNAVADFDPGPGVFNITSNGYSDIFISKLDNNGNFVWAKSMGSSVNEDVGKSIFVDASANIYTTGWFWGTADFDPEVGVYNLSSNGLADIFIQKLSQCHITFDTLNVTTCNSYTLNNQQFVKSGTYIQRLANSVGCDSIITLNLLLTGSRDTVKITSCESYLWQNHLYTSAGMYADTLKNSSGCDSILNLDLIVYKKSVDTVITSICEGDNYDGYTLTGNYQDTLVAKNGCDSIRTLFLTVKKRATSFITASICGGENYEGYTVSGNYIDTLTAANGCDSIRTLTLFVNPKKDTVKDIGICEGDSYFAGGANRYTTGVYVDSLHTAFGCDSIVTTNLKVYNKPMPNLGEDRNFCVGQPASLSPGNFKSYLWQDGSTAPTFTANNTGVYWVTVTDQNNCSASDSLIILGFVSSPSRFLIPTDSICSYEKLDIAATGNYSHYEWSTGSDQSHISIENAGLYSLTVTDSNGCSATETINIIQKNCYRGVYVPNAFTPNGDGNNDIFKPILFGNTKTYSFTIYNRFGQKVFETNNLSEGWDGTVKGIAQQPDIFVWTCTYQFDNKSVETKKGTLMLMR